MVAKVSRQDRHKRSQRLMDSAIVVEVGVPGRHALGRRLLFLEAAGRLLHLSTPHERGRITGKRGS